MGELGFKLFDADNHYYEAEDAFTRYIDPRLRKRAIQWATIDGRKRLLVAGKVNRFIPNPTFDPVAKPGCLDDFYRAKKAGSSSLAEMFGELDPINPAYRNRDERLKVMDTQSLDKVFLFPTLGVGMEEALKHDPEACVGAFHAFNQWLDDDWGYSYQDRLFSAGYITLIDLDQALREVEWLLARDVRILVMRAAPVPGAAGSRSLADPIYDPYWARVNEAGITVAFHGGDHGYNKYADDWGEGGEFMSFRSTPLRGLLTADRAPFDTFAALICHRLFERFPKLRVASIEMGSDWVRTLLKKLAKAYKQTPSGFAEDPVDTFRRHCWVSPFQEENVREMGDLLGADRLLMGSDWPHAEGIAEPRDYLRDLDGFSPAEVRLIMRENALDLAERRPS
jgi:predicted TIM-barrel fold metal-dependent hydrolase